MNKETLEEASIINYKKLYEGEPLTQDVPIDAFKQGAKWKQKRSYNDEEVLKILNEFCDNFYENSIREDIIIKWFQQFKKK